MSVNPFLLPASFRGIPFKVASTNTTFGRRNEVHEYPLRNAPYAEDLGKKAREYSIEAYVIGKFHAIQRDALINAIENNKTPGQLIHPTLGIKTVIPQSCTVNYDNQKGGIESFSLKFIEAGASTFPFFGKDLLSFSGLAKLNAIGSMVSQFTSNFSISKAPEFVRSAAQEMTSNFAGGLASAMNIGVANTENYSEQTTNTQKFQKNIPKLLDNPDKLATSMSGLVSGLSTIYKDPSDAYESQKKLLRIQGSHSELTNGSAIATQRDKNQRAMANLVKGLALVEMGEAATKIKFKSIDEALNFREEIALLMSDQMKIFADFGNNDLYLTLSDIRSTVIQNINERAATLSSVIQIRTQDSAPALVFAYNEYGNVDRVQEIIDRNKINNPLFIPANSTIEVLK